jgi:hypothetical protein
MDRIDALIAAHRRGDIPEMKSLEGDLVAAGYYITYGPAGVLWSEPGWQS